VACAEIGIARLSGEIVACSDLLLELVGLSLRRRLGRIGGFGRIARLRQRRGLNRRSGDRAGCGHKAQRQFKKLASFHQTNPPCFSLQMRLKRGIDLSPARLAASAKRRLGAEVLTSGGGDAGGGATSDAGDGDDDGGGDDAR
jgi:hypothetical protein